VVNDAPIWNFDHTGVMTNDNHVLILKEGSIVSGIGAGNFETVIEGNTYLINTIIVNNQRYRIQTEMILPANSDDFFNDTWISEFNKSFWILNGYLKALISINRESFNSIEEKYINGFSTLNRALGKFSEGEWYNLAMIQKCLEINNVTIHAGGFIKRDFWITNILNINNGYRVTVYDPSDSFGLNIRGINDSYLWNPILFPNNRRSYDLLLVLDNDYLDMYLESQDKRLATFVKVDKVIVDVLNNILKNNNADLSKISFWPRRADGTMDYPPPIDMSSYRPTHRVTDNLRLRDSANTTSLIVTTLPKNTEVQVIETGANTTINNITAPWVKVISSTGFTG